MIVTPRIPNQEWHEIRSDSLVMFNIGVSDLTARDVPGHQGDFQFTRRTRIV
jgi:hypothetical protein